mmetsp:Transcript_21930/g.31785  ORF Transcript_21930/g.31785 Transcript_21930/m.31785 type:complete len:120 (-) Transcript_21930:1053-1412(-)
MSRRICVDFLSREIGLVCITSRFRTRKLPSTCDSRRSQRKSWIQRNFEYLHRHEGVNKSLTFNIAVPQRDRQRRVEITSHFSITIGSRGLAVSSLFKDLVLSSHFIHFNVEPVDLSNSL